MIFIEKIKNKTNFVYNKEVIDFQYLIKVKKERSVSSGKYS